jgi:hypothetical protein
MYPKHHKNEKIVFRPDLASAHYANDTLVRLEELKIEYVPKEENPPNVPQIWPIENFWANLKRIYRSSPLKLREFVRP